MKTVHSGLIELDLHGMSCSQAQTVIDATLRRITTGVYRVRLIHGYRSGTDLRTMIRKTYAKHPKVIRLELGLNPGTTELVIREY